MVKNAKARAASTPCTRSEQMGFLSCLPNVPTYCTYAPSCNRFRHLLLMAGAGVVATTVIALLLAALGFFVRCQVRQRTELRRLRVARGGDTWRQNFARRQFSAHGDSPEYCLVDFVERGSLGDARDSSFSTFTVNTQSTQM